ncbi:DNA-methyltransferase [Lacrimispora amygdalina]|uniref:DNA-methyltransferase n=1 Tax=Lacrimispora amygdalina TaxID=253257 RepID=UPI000BE2DBB4|nr:DNA methyltransferase [Lacrimispora amygdalina]
MLKKEEFNNQLFLRDNLELLKNLPDNSVDLIFCDILYNTGKTFDDYEDKLGNAIEAMEWYEPRLREMWRVIKDTGAVYLHCNYRLIHYLRVELDKVFGFDSFRNEIIWNQGSWKNYSYEKLESAHESMLFYAKPIHRINDNIVKGYTDVWTIEALNQNDKFSEKVGYEGQKPIEYVERVIKISSKPGDLVADFFLGSGTTCVAANRLGRSYLGCDINPRSIELTESRLKNLRPNLNLVESAITNLLECPTGLFYIVVDSVKQICLKTEYFSKHGGVEAFIVESGEMLSCAGMTDTEEGCKEIKVIPITFTNCD